MGDDTLINMCLGGLVGLCAGVPIGLSIACCCLDILPAISRYQREKFELEKEKYLWSLNATS